MSRLDRFSQDNELKNEPLRCWRCGAELTRTEAEAYENSYDFLLREPQCRDCWSQFVTVDEENK